MCSTIQRQKQIAMNRRNWGTALYLVCCTTVLSGCAKDTLNRALYSMGEQAVCAESSDNRFDRESNRATCLAEAMTSNEFDDYKKARQQHLEK